VAVALMVINVLGYVTLGSIECVLVLGGAAYLANQFTDNRTVDIFIGLFVSNILFGCGRLREGFEGFGDKVTKLANEGTKKAADSSTCAEGEKKCNDGSCKAECDDKIAGHLRAASDEAKKSDEAK